MLGHISFGVADLERAATFYDAVLAPLGCVRVWSHAKGAAYGPPGGGDKLALFPQEGPVLAPGPGFHLAFDAPSQAAVGAFHAAALALGGEDRGAPGLRPAYGASYYAAFVSDRDGYRLEAVHQ
ncbi:VOC family protein [Phenylobacterium sp.]|uniref:VOC family protein n=1 Tax=Phenylobacterium sp. TaxID=1871053 RepID=UPI0027378A76|nr:VOC family protein [Phenylobacterium sp.]MDP3868222.1 VOC family protein [Phenylobacterium sp.]